MSQTDQVKWLQSQGLCPTCYNQEHGGVYADFSDRLFYQDDLLYCFLEERPRANGHTILLVKPHYHDLSETPDDICRHVFTVAKRVMNALKAVYHAERVYLCTMCDGPVNHFHVQLIPRYAGTPIGSTNFVKQRGVYVDDGSSVAALKAFLAQP